MAYSRDDVMRAIHAAASRHGAPESVMHRKAEIESSYGRNLASSMSSAKGLFQFTDGTWKRVSPGQDVMDLDANADAAARHMQTVGSYVSNKIGRPLQDWEYYLGWQQGEGGAAKLLANPDARAVDVVGKAAVVNNGGKADMTAGQFANMWRDIYNGPRARIVTEAGGTQEQADGAALAALSGGGDESYIGKPSGGEAPSAMASYSAPSESSAPSMSAQDWMALAQGDTGEGGLEMWMKYRAGRDAEERAEKEDSTKSQYAQLASMFSNQSSLADDIYRRAVQDAIRASQTDSRR